MLWRANLYIDDGVANDWNNLYPWNAPSTGDVTGAYEMSEDYSVCFKKILSGSSDLTDDTEPLVFYGNNEWNKKYQFQDIFNIASMPDGNGKQTVELKSSTWLKDNKIENKVVYDYNGQDTPFTYNYKIDSQKMILSDYFNDKTGRNSVKFKLPKSNEAWSSYLLPWTYSLYTTLVEDLDFQESDTEQWEEYNKKSIDGYSYTEAPISKYKNYIYLDEYDTYSTNNNSWAPDDDNLSSADGLTYKPYLPGLNLSHFKYDSNGYIDWNASRPDLYEKAGNSIGTECVSFVQRSANYTGNPYKWWSKLNDIFWGEAREVGLTDFPKMEDGHMWKIADQSDPVAYTDDTGVEKYVYPNFQMVVPGDIIYYTDPNDHVLMVLHVERDGSEYIDKSKVTLIEATYGSLSGQVKNTNNISDLKILTGPRAGVEKNWIIGRGKNEE